MMTTFDEKAAAPFADPAAKGPLADPRTGYREIRYEHSRNFPAVLERFGVSLLVSTYQAGKLFVVGARQGELALSFHNFEQAMGVAAGRDRVAVGTRNQVWFLRSTPDIAPRLQPVGRYDGCFLARSAHFTGDIHCHELAWAGDELWMVNTQFSCLCTLHPDYSFVPRWRPPFITAMAAEDRCHLNGLAVSEGRPAYATALGQTDTPAGWRPNKVQGGCLLEVTSGVVVARGFAMPHSPRVYRGQVWLLDSGTGRLLTVDPARGAVKTAAELPGYTRGLAFHDGFAFVGLSKIRETAVFGGVPIAQRREGLQCGVAVVELGSGRRLAHLEFQAGVEEIFAVEVLPSMRFPAVSGPYPELDGGATIWSAPTAGPGLADPASGTDAQGVDPR
jgi:uncharacterized protein (TIGR03032 family)